MGNKTSNLKEDALSNIDARIDEINVILEKLHEELKILMQTRELLRENDVNI